MVVPCKCCPLRHHTLETKKKPTIYNQNNCLPHSLLPPHDRMANRSPPLNNIQFDFAVDISSFECNKHRYYNGKTRTVCYMLWPDGKYPTSTADYVWVDCFFPLFATSLIVFYRRELSPHILFELVFVFGTIWIHLKGISFVLTDGSMIFFSSRTTVYHIQFNVWRMKCADTCTSTAYCDDKQEWNHSTKYYIQIRFTGAHLSSLWHFSSKWQIY